MRMKKLRSNADAGFSPTPKAAARTRKDDLKECIVQALFAAGGVNYLVAVARTQPKVFCSLLANCSPVKNPPPQGVTGPTSQPFPMTCSAPNSSWLARGEVSWSPRYDRLSLLNEVVQSTRGIAAMALQTCPISRCEYTLWADLVVCPVSIMRTSSETPAAVMADVKECRRE
jgi:hypothetical protein